MEKNQAKNGQALGAEPTVEKVLEYLKKDLSVAIACLNAMYSDPDLLHSLAIWMHGRWTNSKHLPEVSVDQLRESVGLKSEK